MNDKKKEITNPFEEISLEQYIKRFLELYEDARHENYLAEILMPLLRMCCPENVKIVPVFDDRNPGPKTQKNTENKGRMEQISAELKGGKYVVPDYIFVNKEYKFVSAKKPILMVEVKGPIFNNDNKYCQLAYKKKHEKQLLAEIKACNNRVLYTDGITFMILKQTDNKIEIVQTIALFEDKHKLQLSELEKLQLLQNEWNELKQLIKGQLKKMHLSTNN